MWTRLWSFIFKAAVEVVRDVKSMTMISELYRWRYGVAVAGYLMGLGLALLARLLGLWV